jgi:BTB/POZ domain-containing protein 1/2
MNVDNVWRILEHGHLFDDAGLQKDCFKFILNRSPTVLKSSGIQDLSAASLEKLLEGDDLVVTEDIIFEAALSWADGECRRRHLEATDEHRRTVLGRLLYLIRFPVMEKTYFTDTVSRLNILSSDEKNEVFQFHIGYDKSVCSHFNTKERSFSVLWCLRMWSNPYIHRSVGNVRPDAITFTSSTDIRLHGVLLYCDDTGPATYDVSLAVYDQDRQVACTTQVAHTDGKSNIFEFMLPVSIYVAGDQEYTIEVSIRGPSWCRGVGGEADASVGEMSIRFMDSNRCQSNTSVKEGQIPGFLFSKHTPYC